MELEQQSVLSEIIIIVLSCNDTTHITRAAATTLVIFTRDNDSILTIENDYTPVRITNQRPT